MCGRYALSQSADDIAEEFGVDRIDLAERVDPSWNVAPTDPVFGVLTRKRRDEPDVIERRLRTLRWGLGGHLHRLERGHRKHGCGWSVSGGGGECSYPVDRDSTDRWYAEATEMIGPLDVELVLEGNGVKGTTLTGAILAPVEHGCTFFQASGTYVSSSVDSSASACTGPH